MKTKEELKELKKECETPKVKIKELTEDELNKVAGGEATGYVKFEKIED